MRGEFVRRVLVVPEPEHGVLAKVQLVELYEDGVIVRWAMTADRPSREAQGAKDEDGGMSSWGQNLTLHDNMGTDYKSEGWGGTGSIRWRGQHAFHPAVPATATVLEIRGAEYPIELRLTATAE
jgi:hypothetical protein